MKPSIFCVFLIFFSHFLPAQLTDEFTDGDFTAAPAWAGDRARFSVVDGRLRLDDPAPAASNDAYLSLAAPTGRTTRWECWVRLDFAPSAANFARIYLQSSGPNLRAPRQAYFLQVGGISGDGDALVLYRQDADGLTPLLAGRAGAVAMAPALARVRVERDSAGRWELWADYTGGDDFAFEDEATDTTYSSGRYFGVYCRYTASRAGAFAFDDVLIDPVIPDTIPPRLLSVGAIDATTLFASFDEPLDDTVATQPERFAVDGGVGAPLDVLFDDAAPDRLTLILASPLRNLQAYTLTARGLRDLAGNTAPRLDGAFIFHDLQAPAAGDLLISEIMADPTPGRGVLPEVEYIEVYNRSDKVVDLDGLALSAGGSFRPLPAGRLLPGAYLILSGEDAAAALAPFGDAAAVPGFPALVNSGGMLLLRGATGDTLLRQPYNASWYGEAGKTDGGWSLERIDLAAPGYCPQNWRASLDPAGGTPGRLNSVAGITPDLTPPRLLRAAATGDRNVLLFFDEDLDPVTAADPSRYRISPGLSVVEAHTGEPGFAQVRLRTDRPLSPGVRYTVIAAPPPADCLGNAGAEQTAVAGLPEAAASGDLVINELLFYPHPGGADFAELFNRSDKILDLQGLRLLNAGRGDAGADVTTPFLLFPGEYAVFTPDPADIRARYTVGRPDALLPLNMPSLPSDAGNLTVRQSGITLDSFSYHDGLHSALLADRRGVSLERTDPDSPTDDAGNWHSAAAAAGFATPASPNSQQRPAADAPENIFSLPTPRFSPDGDGFEDVLLIDYQTDRPGYVLNLRIFDAQGRPVRTLANNELLATRGRLKWDGATDDGAPARLGIYILWFEYFTPDGIARPLRLSCVLAGKLRE